MTTSAMPAPPRAAAPTTYVERARALDALTFGLGDCALGRLLVACSPVGLGAVLMGDDDDALRAALVARFPRTRLVADDAAVAPLLADVARCIESPGAALDAPLDLRGSPFQRMVWQALREIPAGTTATYGDIAERIGRPRAVRAVAQACAANPLAVVVPCHRVVGRDGALTGYRWGVERKRALLEREGSRVSPDGGR